jgi:glycosyltransferase involved in cell wall biosynthesis
VAIVRLAFICQAIDRADPVHATTARWVEVLAGKGAVDRVFVLALRTGRYRLPGNVEVREFGARNRPATLARFYREVVRALRGGIDCFFIHQGGPYPLLLLPLKLVLTKPVYQWKAHPLIGRAMAFYARWCDTKVFTSTRAAFPMELPKVRVVGQGIDTEFFRVMDVTKSADLVTVGRVSPIKRVAEMASAVAAANGRYGTSYRLDVVGPILPGDERYLAQVLRLIADRGAGESIRFTGPIDQGELPQVLNRHRAFLHFSDGALDRSAAEAMACGLPVISTNDAVKEILPAELRALLIAGRDDPASQADTLHRVLTMSATDLLQIGRRLRQVVTQDHSVEMLFDRILAEMGASDGKR